MKHDDIDKNGPFQIGPEDSLDDSARRDLMKRIARVGTAAVPVSLVLLNPEKARANTGSTPPFGL